MTLISKLKSSDVTVSKYDNNIELYYSCGSRNKYTLTIRCKLSYALEHYSTVDRMFLENPDGIRTLEFEGYAIDHYSDDSNDRPIENSNGYQVTPCGATSGH